MLIGKIRQLSGRGGSFPYLINNTQLYLRREAAVDASPQLFEDEADAVAWLRTEQARTGVAVA